MSKRESNSSECFHSPHKVRPSCNDILDKFSRKFTKPDDSKCNYIEGLWKREAIGDRYKFSTSDLTLPTFEVDPSLMEILSNCESTDMFSQMKLIGTITNPEKCQFTFQGIIDSETYKQKTKDSISQTNEIIWRFGYEDFRLDSNQNPTEKSDLLTRKELLEMCVEHIKKMPNIKVHKHNANKIDEEEKRLFHEELNNHKGKSEMQLFSEFIKVFPIFKRTDRSLETKFVYLIPNIEFDICPIKSIYFGNSKLLSALEQKTQTDENYNFDEISFRSGFLSFDSKGKFIPYLNNDIKNNQVCGIWIYNDTVDLEGKGKHNINQLVQKACLTHQVWSYLFRFYNTSKSFDFKI